MGENLVSCQEDCSNQLLVVMTPAVPGGLQSPFRKRSCIHLLRKRWLNTLVCEALVLP